MAKEHVGLQPSAGMAHLRDKGFGLFIGVEANIGAGKCLEPKTPVLLFDGRVKAAGAVEPGDQLMGPDSKPRTVLSTCSGIGPMFEIQPKRASAWSCNDVHVLTVVDSLTNETIDIPLNEFLERNKTWRERQKLFSTAVDFPPTKNPEVDPYFIGLWLGDGAKNLEHGGVRLTFPEDGKGELVAYLREFASHEGYEVSNYSYEGRCSTWAIVSSKGSGSSKTNHLLDKMRAVFEDGVCIPRHYKCGSRDVRAAILAGLLDTDGYYHNGTYEIIQSRRDLAGDIAYVARSLGLRVVESNKRVPGYDKDYYRLSISGDATFLPMRVERKKPIKRRQKKVATRFGFRVEPTGRGAYAGFTLDGDGRFLLGNFQVTHNTECCHILRRVRQEYDGPCEVLLEPVGDPRFRRLLGLFYEDPKRWGFTFQMQALQARFRQHTYAAELVANGISVVQDRTIYADGCFGITVHEDKNMTDDEWGIYADTFGAMKRFLRYPDVILYLQTEPQVCKERMDRRARTEESKVPLAYLQRIHDKHEQLVEEMSRYTRVLRVPWNHFGSDIEEVNRRVNQVAAEDRRFMRDYRRL